MKFVITSKIYHYPDVHVFLRRDHSRAITVTFNEITAALGNKELLQLLSRREENSRRKFFRPFALCACMYICMKAIIRATISYSIEQLHKSESLSSSACTAPIFMEFVQTRAEAAYVRHGEKRW